MKNLLVRQCIVTVLVGLFICQGLSVFASGQREDKFKTIDRLIEERQYNDAILLLTQILKDDPERLDEVEVYMQKVRTARNYYNDVYGKLVEAYERGDLEESYVIIKELEDLDKNPNKATSEALTIAKGTAAVVYNNKLWSKIMDEAAKQIELGLYWDAVMTYETGFPLARDIFEEANYGDVVVGTVDRKVAQLKESVSLFLSIQGDFRSSLESEKQAFTEGNAEALSQAVPRVSGYLTSLARLKRRFSDLAVFFERENKAIQASLGNEKDVTYLSYLNRLILGRMKSEKAEGIFGVLDTIYATESSALAESLVPYALTAYDEAVRLYNEGKAAEAGAAFKNASILADAALLALSVRTSNILIGEGLSLGESGKAMVSGFADEYYGLVYAVKSSETYDSIMALRREVEGITGRGESSQRVDEIVSERSELLARLSRYEAGLSEWKERRASLDAISKGGLAADRALAIADAVLGSYEGLIASGLETEVALATRAAALALSPLETRLAAVTSSFSEAQGLLNGSETVVGTGDLSRTLLLRFPDRSEVIFNTLVGNANILANDLQSYIARYSAEKTHVLGSEGYAVILARSRGILTEVQNISRQSTSLAEESRKNKALASRYKQEGEDRIREAESLIPKNDFSRARDRLETAAERIDLSLSYQEDAVLREYRDRQIKDIYGRIQFAENQIVVRDVRNFINSGKAFYSQAEFAKAQDVLLRAQSRWATTNVDPEPEVEYWLQLATTALSVNTGRQISLRDPLYVEMSQVLNRAKDDYVKAKDLMDRRRKDESLVLLTNAEKNILYIQQLFPLNEEASILSLRILQLKDKDNFNEIFRRRFNEARSKMATNPQTAYAELKDLKSIFSDYPGLDKAIYDVEIATGIRVPPPDKTLLTRSADLYRQAYEIVSRNITAQYPIALSYLNEAIKLNPDNVDAITLKDRVQSNIGGGATVVFSSADQQEYKKAEDLFINQRYFEASAIVNRLLVNPDNKRNAKLLELKRRIESKL